MNRLFRFFSVLLTAAMMVTEFCGCVAQGHEAPIAKAKHVVLIGLDGFSAQCLREGKPGDYPTMQGMMKEGAWTLKDRSVLSSSSAQNWMSMFSGVPVEIHGYTTWGSSKPEIKPNLVNEHGMQPTVFSELRRQRPQSRIEVFYEWENTHNLIDYKSVDVDCRAADPSKVDTSVIFAKATDSILKHKPDLTAVCVAQIDNTGHKIGWMTPAYIAKVKEVDANIAKLVKAVEASGMADDTVFIITADHGGKGKGHGGRTLQEMEIPYIVYGKPVVNRGEIKRMMMQYDCAATIAYLLGIERPAFWRGQPLTEPFEKK